MKRNGLTMFCQGLWQVLIWSYTCRLKVLKSEKWHFFLLLQRLMKHAEIVLGSLACNLITLVSTLQRPKSDILSFFKFLQEKVFRLDKKVFAHFCVTLWVLICKNYVAKRQNLKIHYLNESRRLLSSSRANFWKMTKYHFWTDEMLKLVRIWASRASLAQK